MVLPKSFGLSLGWPVAGGVGGTPIDPPEPPEIPVNLNPPELNTSLQVGVEAEISFGIWSPTPDVYEVTYYKADTLAGPWTTTTVSGPLDVALQDKYLKIGVRAKLTGGDFSTIVESDAQGPVAAAVSSRYEGLVATRVRWPTSVNATHREAMSVTFHKAASEIKSGEWRAVFAGFTVGNSGVETGIGTAGDGAGYVEASIEYPVGTYTRITFSGAYQNAGNPNQGKLRICGLATTTPGLDYMCWSDPILVGVPELTEFKSRIWQTSNIGILYNNEYRRGTGTSDLADQLRVGATGAVANVVMGGTLTGTSGGTPASFGPAAFVGTTSAASVITPGDSIMWGYNSAVDATSNENCRRGIIPSCIPYDIPVVNLGMAGKTPANWYASVKNMRQLIPYCSHMVNNLGINDTVDAAAYNTAIAAYFPVAAKKYLCTITPRVNSTTDAYATEAGQTTSYRTGALAHNAIVRTGVAGYDAFIETCRGWVEGTMDSYKFRGSDSPVPTAVAFTVDGLHPNPATAVKYGRDNNLVPASLWER